MTIPVVGGGLLTYNTVKKDTFDKIELQLQQQALMITTDVHNVYELSPFNVLINYYIMNYRPYLEKVTQYIF